MNFAFKMIESALKMINFVLFIMDFVFKMMNFMFKMVDFVVNAPKPGSFYQREVSVLEKINLLFDFGDGLLSYNSYERLLLRVFGSAVPAAGDGGDEEDGLELLPPDVYDSLVAELLELHSVNKHACATGSGPRKAVRQDTVEHTISEHTFTPKINAKSRQLERHAERHAATARSFSTDADTDVDLDEFGITGGGGMDDTPTRDERFHRLYQAGQDSLARKEEYAAVMQEERLDEEGCTFWPMLSTSPRRARRRRPSVDESLGVESLADDQQEDEMLQMDYNGEGEGEGERSYLGGVRLSRAELLAQEETTAARREAEELAEATFHPYTNPRRKPKAGLTTPRSAR